jgi:hypothetical protein
MGKILRIKNDDLLDIFIIKGLIQFVMDDQDTSIFEIVIVVLLHSR